MTSRVSGHDPDIGLSLLIQEKQRAEAAAKKLEAKKMAEEEAAQLASSAKKASSKAASASKVHSFLSLPFWPHALRVLCSQNNRVRQS